MHNSIEIFAKSTLERLLTKWECRHFKQDHEEFLMLLAVSVYFDRVIYPQEIECVEKILLERFKHEYDLECAKEIVRMKLQDYIRDDLKFMQDRECVFDLLVMDIQLYSYMKEIFESDGNLTEIEASVEEILKKEYDRKWKLKDEEQKRYHGRDEKWKS